MSQSCRTALSRQGTAESRSSEEAMGLEDLRVFIPSVRAQGRQVTGLPGAYLSLWM